MTVLAWDGNSIAADKRGVSNGLARTVTKLFRVDPKTVVGVCGNLAVGMQLVEWYSNGAKAKTFPTQAVDSDTFLIVAKHKTCLVYEGSHTPVDQSENHYTAWGSGRDFAIAAMYLGLTATAAVLTACRFETGCGNGVDAFVWDENGDAKPVEQIGE